MEPEVLMEIHVEIQESLSVEGGTGKIVMIRFTGEAGGPYFNGKVIGPGVDTQKITKDGEARISARYIMEGTDAAGNTCRVFVENEGNWDSGFTPSVVTDSPLLSEWEHTPLTANVEGIPGGVMVRIRKKT